VFQHWANTKAAYRFFPNERVDEEAILSGHFQATRDRVAKIGGQVLVLHDTTEFTYKRDKSHLAGVAHRVPTGKDRNKKIRNNLVTVCGILMHSSLVATVEGPDIRCKRANTDVNGPIPRDLVDQLINSATRQKLPKLQWLAIRRRATTMLPISRREPPITYAVVDKSAARLQNGVRQLLGKAAPYVHDRSGWRGSW
jgi:hypothetical protein